MDIEGVIIFDAVSGVPLFSRMKGNTEPSLFSSFVTAIGHFSRKLKFGGLSSFTTEEKVIYLAPREDIITALIAPKKKEYDQAYSLANELGRQFEEGRARWGSQPNVGNDEFSVIADQYLRRIQNPFISRVLDFILKEYGGEVLVRPRLMKRDGSQGMVDLLIDSRKKKKELDNELITFGENYGFVKVVDNRANRVQIIDFIDSLDNFAVLSMKKDEMILQPYFPSKAVVVAREYDPAVFDYLKKFPSDNNRKYIDGAYVYSGVKLKKVPKETRCFLDLWQWQDDQNPQQLNF